MAAADGLGEAEIEALIEARKAAKAGKNFAEADRVRAETEAWSDLVRRTGVTLD